MLKCHVNMAEEVIDPGTEAGDTNNTDEFCYCNGKQGEREINMVQCLLCRKMFHFGCLKTNRPSTLEGDVFFDLTCSDCAPDGQETCSRQNISWLQAIYVALYNLICRSGSGKKGYFRWKEDICGFIEKHWATLLPRKKRTALWTSTVAGTLSVGCPQYFRSGQKEFKEPGWWTLQEKVPPALKLADLGREARPRRGAGSKKGYRKKRGWKSDSAEATTSVDSEEIPALGEETRSESSHLESSVIELTLSSEAVAMDTSSDALITKLLTEEELKEMHRTLSDSQFASDFMEFEDPLFLGQSSSKASEISMDEDIEDAKSEEAGSIVSTTSRSEVACREKQDVASITKSKIKPKRPSAPQTTLVPLNEEQEKDMLFRLNACSKALHCDPAARRMRRKLMLRKLKRERGLPLLDVDKSVSEALKATLKYVHSAGDFVPVKIGESSGDSISSSSTQLVTRGEPTRTTQTQLAPSRVLDRFQAVPRLLPSYSKQSSSFLTRLVGGDGDILLRPIISPYTARVLKPFIRRDYESRPIKLRLMEEIVAHHHRLDPEWVPPQSASLDYCYVQPHHIPSVNAMCREFFWPGIDLSECLQYPDFSCVVLYRKFVIGFAFMVPDVKYNEAYISFIMVHPDWRRAGIASYMLYHLIQTCMGKDVTLHVSATNPAMLMYQKFGFKPEEFVLDFYSKYLPENSPECRHAFFLRLRR